MTFVETIKDRLKKHAVASTAIVSLCNLIFAVVETVGCGMGIGESGEAKIKGSALCFAGMGFLYDLFRDVSLKTFNIDKEDKKKIKLHDRLYSIAYSAVTSPPIYYGFFEIRDPEKIAYATLASCGIALFSGHPMGYAIDGMRDLTGMEESKRLPRAIRELSPGRKKGLAAILVASSITATCLTFDVVNRYGLEGYVPKNVKAAYSWAIKEFKNGKTQR